MRGQKIEYNDNHKIQEDILYKQCNQHNTYFPDEDDWFPCSKEYFYINNKNKIDGLYPYCKRCGIAKQHKYYKDHPTYEYENSKRKYAKNPLQYKERKRRNYQKNPKQYNENQKKWIKNHPVRAAEYSKNRQHKNHKITENEWESCKKYFCHRCAYCDLPIEEHYITRKGITKLGDFHKEHVDHYGSNDLSNCVPSCNSCNSQKWKFLFENWYSKGNLVFNQEKYDKIIKWINEDYIKFLENKRQ